MKILLLGGTGILSTDFMRKCLNEGNEVFILNRGKRVTFIDDRAVLIKADIRNESIEDLKRKVDSLSFEVIIDFLSFEPTQLEKSIEVFKDKYFQYIFISSATAYIKNGGDIISESKNQVGNRNWLYSYNKSLCENYMRDTNINYTIVRPYVTYGESRIPFQLIPDGFHYTLLERIEDNKPVALLDNGNAICTLTNTIDFANVLYRLLLNEKAYREDFHITSSFQQSWRTVYETYCEILNREPHLVSVSIEDIRKYMPEYYQSLVGDKGTSWRFDNSKVLEAVGGYEFKYDLKAGLQKSVDFYEKHAEMQGIDYKWDGKIDYMISHVAGVRKMVRVDTTSPNSTNAIWYNLMTNPLTHAAYMGFWRIKHRKDEKG